MPAVCIESLLEKKDYLDFCRFRSYYMSNGTRNLLLFPLLLVIFAGINLALGNIVLMWVLLAIAAVIPLWMGMNIHLYARKDALRFGLDQPKVFYTFRITDDDIHIENEKEIADYQWKQVWKLYRTGKYMYLYMTPQRGFILPLRCMAEGDAERLWAMAEKSAAGQRLAVKAPFYEK